VVGYRLTIAGVTRSALGEAPSGHGNITAIGLAQAFNRVWVKRDLGVFPYRQPRQWLEYDAQKKRFTDAALSRPALPVSVGHGDLRIRGGPRAGRPLSWAPTMTLPTLNAFPAAPGMSGYGRHPSRFPTEGTVKSPLNTQRWGNRPVPGSAPGHRHHDCLMPTCFGSWTYS
jgi:hypothetical protein